MSDNDHPAIFLALEEQLQADDGGSLRDQITAELQEQQQQIKRQMDRGVAPQEFKTLESLQQALDAAILTIKVVWQRFHPSV